ncbi:hypothetical protein ASG65_17735 [Bacillus sp. Leaf13]|nr:hypothetical protein ASG65_17735 [Bacillus sp. Leaf13]
MKKLALIIGINYLKSFKPLKGCINDTKGITKLLVEKFDFSLTDIQILLEEAATRQNILNSIDYLIKELKPGDIGVLAFSGHGTQIADMPPIDEEDLLDEVIVPYDGIDERNSFPENFIRDDEIYERLGNLVQDVHLTFIFDSCHSGTVTRGGLENRNSNDNLHQARSIPPSFSVTEIKHLVADLTTSRSLGEHHSFSGENYYLLAACKDDQEAKDDETNGYFTAELLRYIEPGITYEQLKEKVVPTVKERSFNEQEPQFNLPNLHVPIFGISGNHTMSVSQVPKVFGIEISPADITIGSDGTVEIRNHNLANTVKQVQEKVIRDLFNGSDANIMN